MRWSPGAPLVDCPTGPGPRTTKDRVTDAELVERARTGDPDAFGVLVERHHRAALRAAVAALGAGADADDAVQDAWIAARHRLVDFRGDAAFRTWLLAIVWHKAADRRRGVGRWLRRLVSMDAAPEPGAAPGLGFVAAGPSPERAALDGEQRRTIARLMRTLPLASYGLSWVQPPLALAHPFDDGTAAAFSQSIDETAASLGQDGIAWSNVFSPLLRDYDLLLDALLGELVPEQLVEG